MFNSLKSILILFILNGFSFLSRGQSFALTSDNLLPLYSGPIKWADLDNDDDLDIIYSGFEEGANQYYVKVYENNNGSFISRSTNLPNIRNGAFTLGDYDKDGDLDILLSGLSSTGNISVLYENNGSFSFSLKQSFTGLFNATASWFDIDNDEDLDFLLAGVDFASAEQDPFEEKIEVYENIGGSFNLINGTNLPPCTQCSMDWADSNGDGKIDLLITGFHEDNKGHTDLFLNNGNRTFTKDTNSIFKDTFNGDAKWGDFDNDGDMDVLLSGIMDDGNIVTSIYKNTGGVLQEEEDIQIQSVGENWLSGTNWVDYNNDGLLDILISGRGTSVLVVEYIFKLYKNNGDATFSEVSETNFLGIADSSVDFGDFDSDGDVDFCFSGMSSTGPKTGIYKNKLIDGSYAVNSKPAPPSVTDFSERFFRKQVKLMCSSGTDLQTPTEGLFYNFYLNHGPSKIVAPTANFNSGYILTTNPANGHGRISTVNDIPEGNNSWAVQSIDGGKSGSLFSTEKTFYQINGPEAVNAEIIDVINIKLNWVDNSSIETSYQVFRSTNPLVDFSLLLATLPSNTNSFVDNYTFLTDTYYYYHFNASNATKASAYDSLIVLIPTAPSDLLATSINASKINLTWEDLSQYESGYEVQRKLSSESTFQTIAMLASNSDSYMDVGLNEGTSYDYRVRAQVSIGSSAFSNISSAQTNFRPLGANFGRDTLEDEPIDFSVVDFTAGFSDPDANDELVEIMIATLPSKGTLKLNSTPVIAGQIILKTDLPDLHFIPLPNENGTSSFSFYNSDGKDNSATSYAVTFTITAVNDFPVFSLPSTVEVNEDFTAPIKITAIPEAIPQDELSQVITYSIQPVISDKVTIQFDSGTGDITLTSVLNKFGEVQFILVANDGQVANNSYSDTVKLVINPINDAPVLSSIPDQQVEYQSEISPVSFTVTDVDNTIGSVIISAISSNQEVIKNENITIQGDSIERTVTLQHEESPGLAVITLTANDGTTSITTQFELDVISVTEVFESPNMDVKIFPNPFSSFLNIAFGEFLESTYTVVLFDQLGREAFRQEVTTRQSTLTFKGLHSGIYMLRILGDNGDILFHNRIIKN